MVACLFLSRAFISSEKRLRAADEDEDDDIGAELGGRIYGGGGGVEDDEADANVVELECETLRIQDADARDRCVESAAFVGVDEPAAVVVSERALQCKEELESDAEEALAG